MPGLYPTPKTLDMTLILGPTLTLTPFHQADPKPDPTSPAKADPDPEPYATPKLSASLIPFIVLHLAAAQRGGSEQSLGQMGHQRGHLCW